MEEIITGTTCLVARRAGRLIGSVFGQPYGEDGWFIGRLMVAPDLQGGGLGRRLLELIEEAAPADTARSVLVTGAYSDRNQAFYRRRGYRVTAEETRGSVPIVVMERLRAGTWRLRGRPKAIRGLSLSATRGLSLSKALRQAQGTLSPTLVVTSVITACPNVAENTSKQGGLTCLPLRWI